MTRAAGCIRVVELAAGGGRTCARVASGKVLCWGGQWLAPRQLPSGDEGECSPTLLADVDDAIDISIGRYSLSVLRKGGRVDCWVFANSGFAERTTIYNLGDVVQISVGDWHGCGVRSNGTVVCWGTDPIVGLNEYRQSREFAVNEIPWVSNVAELASVAAAICARSREGRVWCWGVSNWTNFDLPPLVFEVPSTLGAARLELDFMHQCARRSDGERFCWRGEPDDMFVPVKARRWVGAFGCALRLDGVVECVDPYTNWRASLLAGATSIVADRGHVCALLADGRTLCLGSNRPCSLGRRRDPARYGPIDKPFVDGWVPDDWAPVDW